MSATTSPVSLLRSSHHSAGAAPVPAYPPPHLPFSEFPWLLLPDGTIDQAPRPTLCLICLPFTLVSLACTRAAYVKGLSRLSSPPVSLACRGLCPGPLTTIAMAFLVDIDSFLSAQNITREADDAQGRRTQVQVPAWRQEPQRRNAGEVVALIRLVWCAHELARLHFCSRFTTPGSIIFLNIVPYMWRHSLQSVRGTFSVYYVCTRSDITCTSHKIYA